MLTVLLWAAAIAMACWTAVDIVRGHRRVKALERRNTEQLYRVVEQYKHLADEQKAELSKLRQIIEVYKERERILLWEPLTGSAKAEVKH